MKVGIVGLGAMGLPMAARVVSAGFQTFTTFHKHREPANTLAGLGASLVPTPAEVARAADVVLTILPADLELKEAVFGPGGLREGLSAGKTLIDMTTATAASLQEVERGLTPAGVQVLDAPVSGGTAAAAQGTLTIMVGGDAALLERYRILLESMGSRIIHVGPLGQGKVIKIVNQMMAALHLLTIGESFALGVRCGVDPDMMYNVIKESSGYSRMMDLRLPNFLLAGSFEPGFRLDLMKKDIQLALDTARAEGVPVLLTSMAAQIFTVASAAGYGSEDFSRAADLLVANARASLSKAGRCTDSERRQ